MFSARLAQGCRDSLGARWMQHQADHGDHGPQDADRGRALHRPVRSVVTRAAGVAHPTRGRTRTGLVQPCHPVGQNAEIRLRNQCANFAVGTPPGLYRFLQPVTMTTPAASATVTIFNRIKSGSNGWGMGGGNVSRASVGDPIAPPQVLEQSGDVIGRPYPALVAPE